MIYAVYSVFDVKSKVFSQPFCAINDDVARRMFHSLVNDGQSVPSAHPADFSLHRIATWDDQLGTFTDEDFSNLGLGAAYKEVANASQS